jgi:hypothetical protein
MRRALSMLSLDYVAKSNSYSLIRGRNSIDAADTATKARTNPQVFKLITKTSELVVKGALDCTIHHLFKARCKHLLVLLIDLDQTA